MRTWIDGGETNGHIAVQINNPPLYTLNHTLPTTTSPQHTQHAQRTQHTQHPHILADSPSSSSSFVWPATFIGVYRGDHDEAGYVTQQFVEAVLSPPLPAPNYPFCQYDSWAYGVSFSFIFFSFVFFLFSFFGLFSFLFLVWFLFFWSVI